MRSAAPYFRPDPATARRRPRPSRRSSRVGYLGTPDFLKVILDKAAETGRDVASLKLAHVSGGALFPSLRDDYAGRGISVLQAYATADLGVIAYETTHEGELCEGMVVNEDILVEIVRPGTGDPVPDGEVGEVVVTTLNRAYPLVRFGTGDLSAVLAGRSPCGRTNMRLKGWMGRADQRTKVKGMFVDPAQIAAIRARHPEDRARAPGRYARADLDATRLLIEGERMRSTSFGWSRTFTRRQVSASARRRSFRVGAYRTTGGSSTISAATTSSPRKSAERPAQPPMLLVPDLQAKSMSPSGQSQKANVRDELPVEEQRFRVALGPQSDFALHARAGKMRG